MDREGNRPGESVAPDNCGRRCRQRGRVRPAPSSPLRDPPWRRHGDADGGYRGPARSCESSSAPSPRPAEALADRTEHGIRNPERGLGSRQRRGEDGRLCYRFAPSRPSTAGCRGVFRRPRARALALDRVGEARARQGARVPTRLAAARTARRAARYLCDPTRGRCLGGSLMTPGEFCVEASLLPHCWRATTRGGVLDHARPGNYSRPTVPTFTSEAARRLRH